MSDLISRQAAIDAVKWGESVRTIRDEIERLPGAWKSASVRPEKEGKYLALWSLTEKDKLIYEILNYGTFEDFDDDGTVEKLGWYDVFDMSDVVRYWTELPDMPTELPDMPTVVCDFTNEVRYWTELPDVPEVEE